MDERILAEGIEAARAAPQELEPWLELGKLVHRAGGWPDLTRALPLIGELQERLAEDPRRTELRALLARLLGLEVTDRGHRRLVWWNREGRLGHDELGHYDLLTGFPLFVRLPELGVELNWIPPGVLMAGADEVFTLPHHRVEVLRGFYMGRFPILQGEYAEITGQPTPSGEDRLVPVRGVSWNQASAFCAALTRAARERGRCPATWAFQLPSEIEWEYAGRVPDARGKAPKHRRSDGSEQPAGTNWMNRVPRPVTGRSRHPFGLEDLGTNVLEWCQDAWSQPEKDEAPGHQDPWHDPARTDRVVRGAGYGRGGRYGSLLFRRLMEAESRQESLGFRICFQARPPAPVLRPRAAPGAPAAEDSGVLGTLGRWLGLGGDD